MKILHISQFDIIIFGSIFSKEIQSQYHFLTNNIDIEYYY